ncbi:MAG: hypothetical protein BGO87_15165 [Flavobacteriia bacterium 40-80]|nr:MAG: hypothetical protein BGO87_15165 [Flavobacteriia bacterium 40-80]
MQDFSNCFILVEIGKLNNMKKLKLVLLILCVSFVSGIALAHNGEEIEKQAKEKTEYLAKELQLNETQKESVYEIVSGIMKKNDEINHSKFSSEEKKQILEDNKKAEAEMLKGILSEEQFARYQKLKK